MTPATTHQAPLRDAGRPNGRHDVPVESRGMAAALLAQAQVIHRGQGVWTTLASLEAAERAASRIESCARAMRVNLRRQISEARGGRS